jgi:AraC-like DNA-binding protein
MYAPIYLPQPEVKSSAVAAAERAIIEAEGAFHVGGLYFANDGDARQERRRLAERRVREGQRRALYGECLRGTCDGTPRFRVATLLNSRERQQVEAGAVECVRTVHRDTLADVAADLVNGTVDGALVSGGLIGRESLPKLTALVHGFPSQIVVGMIGEIENTQAVAASVLFGQAGIRAVVDVRTPAGWQDLRNVFDCGNQPDQFIREAFAVVLCDIGETEPITTDGRNEFFRLIFSPRVTSAKVLASKLGVLPSTLMSRFFRAELPSPKQYVAYARLVWAAYLGESPAMSIAGIANRLNASSPQSFHRTVRNLMGMSAATFRESFNGARMLECFRSRLVTPYRETLRTFDPLADSLPGVRPRRPHQTAVTFRDSAAKGRAA